MCDNVEEVDVRVLATIEGSDEDRVLDNATALIHIKDVPDRVFDADDGSVTDGTTVFWQMASDEDPDFTETRVGVKLGWFRGPINDYLDEPTAIIQGERAGWMEVIRRGSARPISQQRKRFLGLNFHNLLFGQVC